MKHCSGTTLLVFVFAVAVEAVDRPQPTIPHAPAQTESARGSQQENSDIPPLLGASADKPRAVSPEGLAYLQMLLRNTPFGTTDFDLKGLRAGMGSRQEPANKDVKL